MDSERVIFLVVGVLVVLVVGQLLTMSGRRYLAGSAPTEGRSAGPAAVLVAVLFYLLTLGIVALLAVVPIGSGSNGLLLRLGILLVALAAVFGITLTLLSRRRQEALAVEIDTQQHATPEGVTPGVRVEPAPPREPGIIDRPMDPATGTATGQPRPDRSF